MWRSSSKLSQANHIPPSFSCVYCSDQEFGCLVGDVKVESDQRKSLSLLAKIKGRFHFLLVSLTRVGFTSGTWRGMCLGSQVPIRA